MLLVIYLISGGYCGIIVIFAADYVISGLDEGNLSYEGVGRFERDSRRDEDVILVASSNVGLRIDLLRERLSGRVINVCTESSDMTRIVLVAVNYGSVMLSVCDTVAVINYVRDGLNTVRIDRPYDPVFEDAR